MRTGVSYLGHHNPIHLETDLREMSSLRLDDVLLAAQENDFVHFTGKLKFTPRIAADYGLRPIAIFWGALNLFGGGQSSQFLLEHPEGFQVGVDGRSLPRGCYVNPACVARVEQMIAIIAELGFQGYFIDEPTPLSGGAPYVGPRRSLGPLGLTPPMAHLPKKSYPSVTWVKDVA